MQLLVSIVIPVYNCEAYVAEAVISALGQNYPNKEVVVVNDGSTDGTLTVLKEFGDAIRLVDQANRGPPGARNAGVAEAKGDYIAFLDADDVWFQGKLAAQVAYMEANADVGACYTPWIVWPADADGVFRPPISLGATALEPVNVNEAMSGWIYSRLLFDSELLTSTVMVRTSVLRRVGEFDRELWNGEDYDLWLRLSQAAKISRLEPAAALYRVLEGSASRKVGLVNDELVVIERALSRYGLSDPGGAKLDSARVKQRIDQLVYRFGYAHLRQGDPRIALRSFMRNVRSHPWRPKPWLYLLTAWIRSMGDGSRSSRA